MILRPMLLLLKWVVVLALLGGGLVGGYLVHTAMREEREREAASEKVQSPRRVNEGLVTFGQDTASRYGLEEVSAQAVKWQERVSVYGRVVPNPRATTEVRAPFAGVLRAAGETSWPGPGQWIEAKQNLGKIDVRVGPEVLIDLENKLREARIKEKGAQDVLKLQQNRVDSLRSVTDQAIIARSELDLALVQLEETRTQLATARAAVELYQKAREELEGRNGDKSPWSEPLSAPAAGEVTELAARPGTAVEAGALLLQLVDPRRPLVRLDFPPEALSVGPPSELELETTFANAPAHLVGPAPRLDAVSQFAGFWYEVNLPPVPRPLWRPGLQVKAQVPLQKAQPQPAVSVPATAVLYHLGRALVYVRTEPGKYKRWEVQLLGREGDNWIVNLRKKGEFTGVAPGDAVVSRQAQLLLSEEFRSSVASD